MRFPQIGAECCTDGMVGRLPFAHTSFLICGNKPDSPPVDKPASAQRSTGRAIPPKPLYLLTRRGAFVPTALPSDEAEMVREAPHKSLIR